MLMQDIKFASTNIHSFVLDSIEGAYIVIPELIFYIALIVLYCIFIFKFYKFIAEKDVINLNLAQYNKAEHETLKKIFASFLFIIEYLMVMPFLVIFWFSILTFLLLLLSQGRQLAQILMISAALVGTIRVSSYLNKGLAQDIAKLFPFTLLVIFLLNPDYSEFIPIFENLKQAANFLPQIIAYLLALVSLEMGIRIIDTCISLIFSRE